MMIKLDNVYKSFNMQPVLSDFSMEIVKPSITCIMGASGSGKTTLLRIIAGLEQADAGNVFIDGRVGYVFQEARLFPWLSALDNVCCVKDKKKPRASVKKEAVKLLEKLGLGADLYKRPAELSGGMQQRVAFARAVMYDPDILLLDEAFGSQDKDNAEIMYGMCKELVENNGKVIIAVTHDREEAENLSDGNIINL